MTFGDLFSSTLSIVLKVIKRRLLMVNTDKPMKKRLRLLPSSDEDHEPPAALPKSSSRMGESSSVKKDKVVLLQLVPLSQDCYQLSL